MLVSIRRISVYLALAFVASYATASEMPFFGPKRLTIEAGKPKPILESFSVDAGAACQGKAAFVLVVENSGVSSAEIRLNGKAVLSESDFGPNRTHFEKPITLLGENSLAITLKGGKTGSFLDISIRREIESPIAPPETYVLSSNRQVFRQTHHVGDAIGVFTLVVRNGNATGGAGVRSGTILVDGVAVISDKELGASVDLVRKRVSLRAESVLSIDVKGSSGDTLTVGIYRQLPASACPGVILTMTAPAEGAVVDTRGILVQGTAAGPADLGITVNGAVADIDLTRAGTAADPFRWAALVSDEAGAVTLLATASTPSGESTTAIRHVQFAPPEEWVEIEPVDRSGPAPLSATFRLRAELVEDVSLYEADLDGDGSFELSSATLPEDLSFTYATPGVHTVTARVATASGRKLFASATIFVQSFAAMNELLQHQWTGFVSALGSGSVEAALPYLAGDETKQKYKRGLELIRPTLSQFAAGLATIEPVWISGRAAHYLLTRTEGTRLHGYHVYFVRDLHGVWRIAQF